MSDALLVSRQRHALGQDTDADVAERVQDFNIADRETRQLITALATRWTSTDQEDQQ